MNRNRIPHALLLALLGAAVLTGCKKKEEAPVVTTPPPAAEPAPLPSTPPPAPASTMATTASVTGVDLGNTIGADMKVGTPASTFAAKDTIYASIATATADPTASIPAKLGTKWTHVDSNQVVSEESRDVTLSGTGSTEFHIAKPDGWPPGKYRVDVTLDGTQVQSREFEVK